MENSIAEKKLVHGQVLRLLQEEAWAEEGMRERSRCKEKEAHDFRSQFGQTSCARSMVRSSPLGNRPTVRS
jgi:hypothetical protein